MFNIPFLMGAPAGEGSSAMGTTQIIMIVAVFAVFYFLIIRPQRKKQRDAKNMIAAIKKGDQITSIGGIRGTVKNVQEKTVIVEIDNKGATLEFTKTAIGSVDTVSDAPARSIKNEKEEPESSEDK